MSNIRIERLNHTYQEEISKIIMSEIKDPDIKFVTITGVDVTKDLSLAKVYFTVLDDNKRLAVTESLNKASHFIRRELASRIEIRNTPELKFIYDTSIEYGKHIDSLIDKINN
jgi:ribosome-binding factor A